MSIAEQDEILGRLAREISELRRNLAFVDAELQALANGLGTLVAYVNGHVRTWNQSPPDPRTEKPLPAVVEKYAEMSKLANLIGEGKRLAALLREKQAELEALLP